VLQGGSGHHCRKLAGANQKQSAKLETGTQAFFAYYNPSGWTGRVHGERSWIR